MGVSYSGHDVIEMGIQIEEKGYNFYNFLASRAKRNALKELYAWLAEQEKSHIALFDGLRSSFEDITLNGPYNWSEVAAYFRALIDTKVFPDDDDGSMLSDEINDEIGAIQIAISFEKDNILFFQEIRDMVDEQDKDIINKLIDEEKAHILRLLNVKRQLVEFSD